MTRRNVAIMLAVISGASVAALAATVLVVVQQYDVWPQSRHPPWIFLSLCVVAIVAATGALCLVLRRRSLQIVAGCLGGLLLAVVVYVAAWVSILAAGLEYDVKDVVSRTTAPDGTAALVVRRGLAALDIDPSYNVVLQDVRDPSHEVVVWQGPEEGEVPRTTRFVGAHEIEIVGDDGCRYRSTFATGTLTPDRVHVQSAPAFCAAARTTSG